MNKANNKMNKRPKIYYLLARNPQLHPLSGDRISEINIIKALSLYYDVYYNNILFDEKYEYRCKNSVDVELPNIDYDLHIVRNNSEIFNRIKNPKIYFASPYDEVAFKQADALYTFTDSWTNKLKKGYNFPYNLYPENYKTNKSITINQVIDPIFFVKNIKKTSSIKKDMGDGFIIGHFGKISNSCYPHSFLNIIPKLKKFNPNINIVFAGNDNSLLKDFEKKYKIKAMKFDYSDMASAISACNLILYNYRDGQGHIAGSMKVLEAMACGIPILLPRYDARVEELGQDYELFYKYENICNNNAAPTQDRFSKEVEDEMYFLLEKSIKNPKWLENIGNKIKNRASFYSLYNSADRFKKILDPIIGISNDL